MITPTDKAQAEQAAFELAEMERELDTARMELADVVIPADSLLTLPEALKQLALLTSEVETLRHTTEVARLQAEYISLLEAEISELAGMAHVHGWQSSRYWEGERLRAAIRLALQQKAGGE